MTNNHKTDCGMTKLGICRCRGNWDEIKKSIPIIPEKEDIDYEPNFQTAICRHHNDSPCKECQKEGWSERFDDRFTQQDYPDAYDTQKLSINYEELKSFIASELEREYKRGFWDGREMEALEAIKAIESLRANLRSK